MACGWQATCDDVQFQKLVWHAQCNGFHKCHPHFYNVVFCAYLKDYFYHKIGGYSGYSINGWQQKNAS